MEPIPTTPEESVVLFTFSSCFVTICHVKRLSSSSMSEMRKPQGGGGGGGGEVGQPSKNRI
jgi:hypothetical protein